MRRRNRTMITICLFLLGLLMLAGCGSPSSAYEKQTVSDGISQELVYAGSMELQYAGNFTVDY